MKSFIVLCIVIACVVAQESRFSAIDVEKYLQNDRAYNAMYKCLMETGPCSPEGKELKRRLPEAIATTCGTCTAAEKDIARGVIRTLMNQHKEDWDKLVKKYDPEGKYIATLEQFIKG